VKQAWLSAKHHFSLTLIQKVGNIVVYTKSVTDKIINFVCFKLYVFS
jgi:hypothetical protein